MSDSGKCKLPAKGQFLVYMAEDGRTKLEVRLENETVWLTQQHMAELFQTTVPNVSMHLRNIYAEGELQPTATIKEFLIVRQEGARKVSRSLDFYNLDAIISVGYRVKSAVATRFRIWATQKLREFIVKGFVLDDERLKTLISRLITSRNCSVESRTSAPRNGASSPLEKRGIEEDSLS
jgi:hypothetical protein